MVLAVLLGGLRPSGGLALKMATAFPNDRFRAEEEPAAASGAMVQRIVDGDRAAEEELVARYARGVRLIISRASSDRSAVDDLCQETFRITLEKVRRGDVRDPSRLAGFVCSLARNLVVDHFRRTARTSSVAVFPDAPDPSPDPLDQLLARERAASARAVLAELGSERDRQILLRFYVDGESKEDICADFGLSSLHFNRVLFRARERYRVLYRSIAATAEK
jgi:RNA polymerase sigma-70 factor (ECF subfamily)